MKITSVYIANFKSIAEVMISNPNHFSVFVGPNGAGKSNIFEAIEFAMYYYKTNYNEVIRMFKGAESIVNFSAKKNWLSIGIKGEGKTLLAFDLNIKLLAGKSTLKEEEPIISKEELQQKELEHIQLISGFTRLFLNNENIVKVKIDDDSLLNSYGSNLPKVLKRVLQNPNKRDEIIEWLQILIPEFKDIAIETSNLSGEVNYVIYEKYTNKPFPVHLISDGSKNILSLLVAVYQRDEPQFLCIEEPENGLHPYAIENLVSFFRNACKDKGHYIWLNTHSQTLVRNLTAEEIIVVEKKEGQTKIRQFQNENLYGLKMDEAWLTNALGGGLP